MTKRDLALVACRFLAVFFLYQAFYSLISLVYSLLWFYLRRGEDLNRSTEISYYFAFTPAFELVFFLIIGFIFWFRAYSVADWMTIGMDPEIYTPAQRIFEWQAVAFAVLGFYILGTSVTHADSWLRWLLSSNPMQETSLKYISIGYLLQMALGGYLILQCNTIATYVLKPQTKIPPDEEGESSQV